MSDDKAKTKNSVIISPDALVSMMLHAARHGTTAVHGVLMGSFGHGLVTVASAIPVCHEAPTKPLVETALALVACSDHHTNGVLVVVGWYTAPERLHDQRPGSAALRIAANLATDDGGEPVLVVLNNENVAKCLRGTGTGNSESLLKALGKDFGQQWLEPRDVTITSEATALEAAQAAYQQKVIVNDFVDHLESETAATVWYPNEALKKCVAKHC